MGGQEQGKEEKHILLAEDDPVFRATMEEFLRNLGYRVIPVDNAIDAMRVFMEKCRVISMLITDICMPKADDGIELIRGIRRLDSALPIIVATSYDEYQFVNKDDNLNTVIFSKPFHFEAFHSHLNKLQDGHSYQMKRHDQQ